ncbi:hypothetical protein [Desulfoluna sp.]|uniref:hypothetical protein n=1 Tax=Desulfoluna sp. TaxID=2045199 RepID=UPI002626B6A0|nr:hypothetical protein [Desulfoluna sp.]
MPQETLMTIHTFTAPQDAHLAKAQLESCGIEAFVFDDHLVGIQPWYSHAVGGVKLRVFVSDRQEALAVLGYEDSRAEKADRCPVCESYDIDYERKIGWGRRLRFGLFLLLFLGIPWFFRRRRWVCHVCGHSWTRPLKYPG